jgi:protein-S-isoprenylcysteine O-methyltransferase Ste14
MSIGQNTYKMDIGRLTILPIFSMLVVSNLAGVYADIKALEQVSTIKVATLIHHMLLICFYSLVVFLYFIRSAAKSTTKSLIAKTIALIASFLPFAIPFLSNSSDNSGIMLLANLITVFGMTISLYSLGALGRSFSIIPQARALVQFSISATTIYCLIIILQIYRALQEERLLADIFPEYESYSLKKARFLPGIF